MQNWAIVFRDSYCILLESNSTLHRNYSDNLNFFFHLKSILASKTFEILTFEFFDFRVPCVIVDSIDDDPTSVNEA